MDKPNYLDHRFRRRNEPVVPPLIKQSFVFVPTVGVRSAPEILVLELMREIFFENSFETSRERQLDPKFLRDSETEAITKYQAAVLCAFRGRRKQTKQSLTIDFYAPAYPSLAKYGWLRKSEAPVISKCFLGGPIAQDIWRKGPDAVAGKEVLENLITTIRDALVGTTLLTNRSKNEIDIFAATLADDTSQWTTTLSLENLRNSIKFSDSIMQLKNDELSNYITKDTRTVCELENKLPRLQWLQILMTFLRFALPMWLLAHMRITILVYEWLVAAIDSTNSIPDERELLSVLEQRNRLLLQPTLTPTRELYEHIERYMKYRIELSILIWCLKFVCQKRLSEKRLTVLRAGRDKISVTELLILARKVATEFKSIDRFKEVANGKGVKIFTGREAEQFSGWRDPFKSGQGKNILEFFRVLYKAEAGDESGGYLLTPEGRSSSRSFRVFPGQMLLKTITQLASEDKKKDGQFGLRNHLVLADVEDHFARYGIDFAQSAEARPMLMKRLQEMGLLVGSPDAGRDVKVFKPFS